MATPTLYSRLPSATVLNPDTNYAPNVGDGSWGAKSVSLAWPDISKATDEDDASWVDMPVNQSLGIATNTFPTKTLPNAACRWQTPTGLPASLVLVGMELNWSGDSGTNNSTFSIEWQTTPGSAFYSTTIWSGASNQAQIVQRLFLPSQHYKPGSTQVYATLMLTGTAASRDIVNIYEIRFLYLPRGLVRFVEIG